MWTQRTQIRLNFCCYILEEFWTEFVSRASRNIPEVNLQRYFTWTWWVVRTYNWVFLMKCCKQPDIPGTAEGKKLRCHRGCRTRPSLPNSRLSVIGNDLGNFCRLWSKGTWADDLERFVFICKIKCVCSACKPDTELKYLQSLQQMWSDLWPDVCLVFSPLTLLKMLLWQTPL